MQNLIATAQILEFYPRAAEVCPPPVVECDQNELHRNGDNQNDQTKDREPNKDGSQWLSPSPHEKCSGFFITGPVGTVSSSSMFEM